MQTPPWILDVEQNALKEADDRSSVDESDEIHASREIRSSHSTQGEPNIWLVNKIPIQVDQ